MEIPLVEKSVSLTEDFELNERYDQSPELFASSEPKAVDI